MLHNKIGLHEEIIYSRLIFKYFYVELIHVIVHQNFICIEKK